MNEKADSGPDSRVYLDVCLHDFGVAGNFLMVVSGHHRAAQKHGDAISDGSDDFHVVPDHGDGAPRADFLESDG